MTNKSIHSVILNLSDTEKEKFFVMVLDENYGTNRNNAILEMIRKITTLLDINIQSLNRKYQKSFNPLLPNVPF